MMMMMMTWMLLLLLSGMGHHSLAHSRHRMLGGDRQSTLGCLAQVPVRSYASLGGPCTQVSTGTPQSAAAPHTEMYALTIRHTPIRRLRH